MTYLTGSVINPVKSCIISAHSFLHQKHIGWGFNGFLCNSDDISNGVNSSRLSQHSIVDLFHSTGKLFLIELCVQ